MQEAFAEGKLKPGLNIVEEKKEKVFINNVGDMKKKLNEIKLNLPWIETLDMINKQAPLAPELAAKLHENEQRRANQLENNKKLQKVNPADDPIINDFKREMMFHRQAQAAVVEGIGRLKAMNIVTKRPDDYFAEMAKTDEHMQKVRDALMKRQTEEQRREKVRQLRIQRKEGKAIQAQLKLKRQEEKKELMDQVKKVRKGQSTDMDFLNDNKPKSNKKSIEKQKYKNKKFGFGGKKKGMKRNTKDSASDISEYRRPGKPNLKNKMGSKGGVKGGNKRLGKNRRQKVKNRNKK